MNNIDVVEIERVRIFEQRLKRYQDMRKALSAKFAKALEDVGRTWKDADYRQICELSELVKQQLQAAGRVVDEHLVPFVVRKRTIMDEKKRSPFKTPR
jgi:hypothetical protein